MGSGAYGFVASILQYPAIGPDSYTAYLVSTLQGSTETTFYVLAVTFGAVQVRAVQVRVVQVSVVQVRVAFRLGSLLYFISIEYKVK